jgi:hypothetical protein
VKKYLNVFSVIALIAGLTVLASCSNPTEPRGFRGQISGIVFDTVTAQPIPDVVVRIAGLTKEVKTSENGDYLFQDIEPGTYTISFSKEGYQFRTKNVFVDPEQYKQDDPFAEYEAFIEKIKAGDEKVPNKLKYDYTTVLPLYLTGLAPLNGTLKGSIKLFTTPESDLLTQSIDGATDIIDGVEIWFKDTSFIIGYDDQGNLIPLQEDTIYGPVLTTDGTFEITGLPVGEDLELTISSFFLDDGSYFAGKPIYAFDYGAIGGSNTGFTDVTGNHVVAENNVEDALTNVGTFYLFTEGKFAVVTANSTGSPTGPVSPTGSITLTFSEPINDATFKAVLDANPPAPNTNTLSPAKIALAAAWDTAKTTVTLTPASLGNGYLRIAFPYSINAANPVGFLTLEGKAASGAEIYAEGIGALKGIPVFTEEGINLVSIDTTTAGSARTISVARTRIRLTFSKDINLDTASFGWGTSPNVKDAEFFAVSGDTKSVDVSTELLFSSAVKLAFTVAALADPNDSVSEANYTSLDTFERASAVQKLTLTSTNLYTNKDGAEIDAGGTNANFNYTNNITLTFDRALTGATAKVAIVKWTTPPPAASTIFEATPGFITLTPSISGSTLTITPTDPLLSGTQYGLAVEISQGNNVLFDSGVIAYYSSATNADKVIAVNTISGTPNFNVIAFKTAKEEILLKKTNLWDNRISWTPPVSTGNANFPVDSTTIVLTFDKPIAAYDVGVFLTTGTHTTMPAHIPDSLKLTDDPTISGSILTIPLKTGVLQYDTPYTLIVEVKKDDGKNILDLTNYGTEYAEFVALSSGNITFTTETSELLLSSTTIYDAYAVPAGQFPPTPMDGAYANFPPSGTISLTFNKAIPAGAQIKTALGTNSTTLDYGTDKSIYTGELQVSTDRKTITIPTTNLDLSNDKNYYLKVKIDASSTVTLFDTDNAFTTGLNADLVATDTTGKLIYFTTPQTPTTTTNMVSGTNTLTNIASNGTLEVGKTYYIQFGPNKLVTSITSSPVTYNSNDPDVEFRIAKVNDYVLSVTPVAGSGWPSGSGPKTSVSFSIGSPSDSNTINLSSTLLISNLTVQR